MIHRIFGHICNIIRRILRNKMSFIIFSSTSTSTFIYLFILFHKHSVLITHVMKCQICSKRWKLKNMSFACMVFLNYWMSGCHTFTLSIIKKLAATNMEGMEYSSQKQIIDHFQIIFCLWLWLLIFCLFLVWFLCVFHLDSALTAFYLAFTILSH